MRNLIVVLFALLGGHCSASERAILPIIVQVLDKSDSPVAGASIHLPQSAIDALAAAAKEFGFDKQLVEEATKERVTDKLGFALLYHLGGVARQNEKHFHNLPGSIEVRKANKHLVTFNLSTKMLESTSNTEVAPLFRIRLPE